MSTFGLSHIPPTVIPLDRAIEGLAPILKKQKWAEFDKPLAGKSSERSF